MHCFAEPGSSCRDLAHVKVSFNCSINCYIIQVAHSRATHCWLIKTCKFNRVKSYQKINAGWLQFFIGTMMEAYRGSPLFNTNRLIFQYSTGSSCSFVTDIESFCSSCTFCDSPNGTQTSGIIDFLSLEIPYTTKS